MEGLKLQCRAEFHATRSRKVSEINVQSNILKDFLDSSLQEAEVLWLECPPKSHVGNNLQVHTHLMAFGSEAFGR